MSKFKKWKERHDGLWYMFLLPMAVGLVAIPTIVLSVCAIMEVSWIKKVVTAIGIVIAGTVLTYLAGVVLCLFGAAIESLWEEIRRKDK